MLCAWQCCVRDGVAVRCCCSCCLHGVISALASRLLTPPTQSSSTQGGRADDCCLSCTAGFAQRSSAPTRLPGCRPAAAPSLLAAAAAAASGGDAAAIHSCCSSRAALQRCRGSFDSAAASQSLHAADTGRWLRGRGWLLSIAGMMAPQAAAAAPIGCSPIKHSATTMPRDQISFCDTDTHSNTALRCLSILCKKTAPAVVQSTPSGLCNPRCAQRQRLQATG